MIYNSIQHTPSPFSLLRKSFLGISAPSSKRLFLASLLMGTGVFLLTAPEAYAVKAGEMKTSVDYLAGLLDNNIVPAVIGTGVVAGTGFAFLKQQFSPLVISLCTAIGYGFANKWVSTVYALCI